MHCGVGSEDPVFMSARSSEDASYLLQWLQERARVPAGSASIEADGITLKLELKALQALKWFDIRDNNDLDKSSLSINCARLLLQYVLPYAYDIKINLKERQDMEVTKELLSLSGRCLAEGGILELQLYHHWRHVCSGDSDIFLQSLLQAQTSNGTVRRFRGCLSSWGVKQLPDSLEKLGIALCCPDQAHKVLQALKDRPLPNLDTLRVHIRSGSLMLEHLAPLTAPAQENAGQGVLVYISRVLDSDGDWVAKVLKTLQPSGRKIQSLQLPSCELSVDGYKSCLRTMATEGVAVENIVMKASRHIAKFDDAQLQGLTSQYMQGTRFHLWNDDEHLDF